MENKIRSTLNEIYFGKTKDIVNDLRYKEMFIVPFLFSRCLFFQKICIWIASPKSTNDACCWTAAKAEKLKNLDALLIYSVLLEIIN